MGKQLCQSLFLKNSQEEILTQVYSSGFCKIIKNIFFILQNTSGWLFLKEFYQ